MFVLNQNLRVNFSKMFKVYNGIFKGKFQVKFKSHKEIFR